jgi:outer membrane protein TolC
MGDPVSVAAAASQVADTGLLTPFTVAVEYLKAAGPLGLAVVAGWWGLKKDREKNEATEKALAAAKAAYDQMVTLVAAQTGAMTKTEAALSALKDVISTLERHLPRP